MHLMSWNLMSRTGRASFLAGVTGILLFSGAAGWWLLRADQGVLFSELRPQDAALMTAELDKLKVPYVLVENGSTVLVERSQVHATRLKLMGKDLPLNGAVGFELFNHTDFGMTEFAQKINYQRALQGELTRTILSFSEVRDARVHLALPEQGLFRQNAARPKAAITLHLREGQSLRREQVGGIQRLVAAAVTGLTPPEVTIVDQQGVPLTRTAEGETEGGSGNARLELKRETENYLARKATAVLEQAYGVGQALASVDVTLNMDQVRVTTEDVIPSADVKGGGATGVLVRERESARDSAAADGRGPEGRGPRGSSMQRDVEYQPGRRVEHVVSHAGAIRRIHVVAVVRAQLGESEREQMLRVVGAAVGAWPERGDSVVVQSLQPTRPTPPDPPPALPTRGAPHKTESAVPITAAALVLACAFLMALFWRARTRARAALARPTLSDAQRQATLARVQQWMLDAPADSPANGATKVGQQ